MTTLQYAVGGFGKIQPLIKWLSNVSYTKSNFTAIKDILTHVHWT